MSKPKAPTSRPMPGMPKPRPGAKLTPAAAQKIRDKADELLEK